MGIMEVRNMDYKSIQEIIKTVSDSELSFLEIESEGVHITMKKGAEQVIIKDVSEIVKNVPRNESVEQSETIASKKETSVSNETKNKETEIQKDSSEAADDKLTTIVSPIVGTFYICASPDSEPFVTVGKKVKKGDVLCIVEAMKLMNEIESEVNGEIVEISVKNEHMVEYGQVLFKIKEV
jgi:acetyl-CoA carboxylase biotin carboxyl carrier protein